MFETFVRKIRNWRNHQTTRRQLALLDDWLLADMGAERGSIDEFVARHTR